MPISLTCMVNSALKIPIAILQQMTGAVSHANAPRSCWAVHSAVGGPCRQNAGSGGAQWARTRNTYRN